MNENFLEVYRFILAYKLSHDGNSPTVREIVEGTAYNSTSAVKNALHHLHREGLIVIPRETLSRRIEVVGAAWLDPEAYRSARKFMQQFWKDEDDQLSWATDEG